MKKENVKSAEGDVSKGEVNNVNMNYVLGKGEKGDDSEINVNDAKEKDVVEAAGDESQCDVKDVKELEAASDDKSDESQRDVYIAEKEDGKEIEITHGTKSDKNKCDVKDAETKDVKEMDLVIGNSKSDENKSGIECDGNDVEEVEVSSNSKSEKTESEIDIIDVNKDSGEGDDGSKENSYGEVENMSEETEARSATSTDHSTEVWQKVIRVAVWKVLLKLVMGIEVAVVSHHGRLSGHHQMSVALRFT